MMTSSIRRFQTPSYRQATRWGLIAVLVLLLLSSAGAPFGSAQGGQGSGGAEGQGSNPQSPIPNTQALPASRTVVYAYDAAGRLASADYGGGAGIAYSYDAAGNLLDVSAGGGRGIYLPLVLR